MDLRRFNTVNEMIENSFASFADHPAFTCLGHTMTYREIDHLSLQFACYLRNNLKLEPGDRIAIQLPNLLQYPVVAYGAIRAGLVLVNTNPLYTARELSHQLKDSGARVLVVLANVAESAAQIVLDTEVEHIVVTEAGDLLPGLKGFAVNWAIRFMKRIFPPFSLAGAVPFNRALALGQGPLPPVAADPELLLALQYTGGTTGVAKGAMLSHRNLCANYFQILEHNREILRKPAEILAAALPLYHIYAFTMHAICGFACGAHNILIPNPRDMKQLIKSLKPFKCNIFIGVNTLYNAMARSEEFARLDFSEVMTCSAGGMAVTEPVAERWKAVTGHPICEGYGLSETSPVLTFNPPSDIRSGTIGTALVDTEIKILDEMGSEVEDGTPGELTARGPQVMSGYWQRENATAEVLDKDGWFKTGDVAIRLADGYYKIVDRIKDLIIVSGFKVYPHEVEEVVYHHPAVVEAAVVGIPSESTGEAVKLFVVVSDQQVTEQVLMDFCRQHLTAYKVPRQVEFRTSLPKSNVGKILRKDLRPAPRTDGVTH